MWRRLEGGQGKWEGEVSEVIDMAEGTKGKRGLLQFKPHFSTLFAVCEYVQLNARGLFVSVMFSYSLTSRILKSRCYILSV